MRTDIGRRWSEFVRSLGPASGALLALIVLGFALRIVTELSWWPTATNLADSGIYAKFAESNPFADPQHPAGYALILASIGAVTREVAVPIVLQHLTGIASALLLYGATRRITGSVWAGLLPAAIVLLNPDEVLLEHAIMAESWAILAASAGLYAAVRAIDEPRPLWRLPLGAGLLLALAVTIRTAGLAMLAVVRPALRWPPPREERAWRSRALGDAARGGGKGAAVVLVSFALANAAFGPRFGIGPSPGWHLLRARRAVRGLQPVHAAAGHRGTVRGHAARPAARRALLRLRPVRTRAAAVRRLPGSDGQHGGQAAWQLGEARRARPARRLRAVGLGEPAGLLGAEPDAGRRRGGRGARPVARLPPRLRRRVLRPGPGQRRRPDAGLFRRLQPPPPSRPARGDQQWQQVSRFGGRCSRSPPCS